MKLKILLSIPIVILIAIAIMLGEREQEIVTLLLAIGFIYSTFLIYWGVKKGLHNEAMLEEAVIDEELMNQKFKTESLYRNLAHTDEWLQGFAMSMEFLINNYLSKETIGPSERSFWHYMTGTSEKFKKVPDKIMQEAYRTYIINALMLSNNITTEEYSKLASMTTLDNVKETLGNVIYTRAGIKGKMEDMKQTISEISETVKKNEKEN